MTTPRILIAQIDRERRKVYASLPETYRFVKAVRGLYKKAFNESYSKRDIEVLFNSILKTHKVDTTLGWNWGEEIMSSTMKVFRELQSRSRSLGKADFDDLLSHVVTTLATGTDSIGGTKYGHGDIGQICREYLDRGKSVLDIVKLVKNRVFQFGMSWIRRQVRHNVVNEKGKSLQDSVRDDSGRQLSERIVDMEGLSRTDQTELRTDLRAILGKIEKDLERIDPALGLVWKAYMENPDVENTAKIGQENISVFVDGRQQDLALTDALNKLFIEGTNLKPYNDRSVYYLVTKIRTYLKSKWGDVIDAALSR